jgi:hypothetical protein
MEMLAEKMKILKPLMKSLKASVKARRLEWHRKLDKQKLWVS